MNLKYKYLSTNPTENCVEVRFYTDKITEESLVTNRHPDGSIQRCRSDVNIMLPYPAPVGVDLEAYILQFAPKQWFEHMERNMTVPADGVFTAVSGVVGQEYVPGQTAPLNASAPSALPVTALDSLKKLKMVEINAYRERVLAAGVVFNGYQFDSDTLSVQRLTAVAAAVGAGIPLPTGFTWRSAANVDVPMNGTAIIALLATMMAKADEIYKTSWAKKRQVEVATTEAEVNAVVWVEPGVV